MKNLPKIYEYTSLVKEYNIKIEQVREINQQLDKIYSQFYDRVNEIITIIFEVFGYKRPSFMSWYGGINREGTHSQIDYEFSFWIDHLPESIDRRKLSTHKWLYYQGIPTEFLSMNNEDIRAYIKAEILEFEQKRLQEEMQNEQTRKEEIQKKNAILSKLTDEEKKILGVV